jgi:hypothetical protein
MKRQLNLTKETADEFKYEIEILKGEISLLNQ